MSEGTYDIIVAGGGTCGCIIAGRLAAADPNLRILLIETGPPTHNDPLHVQPARYLYHLRPESTTVRFHVGQQSEALGGRSPVVPCGQCLGGGSSVNFTMYTRAAASDYDDWANLYGNPGWSSADLLPLLRECETYQLEPGEPTHGYSGPLKVSRGGFSAEVGQQFLDVAAAYDKTRGYTDDANALFECDKYGVSRGHEFSTLTLLTASPGIWIDAKTGHRSDIPHHYIYDRGLDGNLRILTGYSVKRVIFEGNRATGVEYLANPGVHPDAEARLLTATARKLVVVSAGAFGSPAILERSGIGAARVLTKVGVQQIVDLPGVGENYQDHQVIFAPYVSSDDVHTLDGIVANDQAEIAKWTPEWQEKGTGMLADNGIDAGIKLRPTEEDLRIIGDSFTKRWEEIYLPVPDKPVLWMGTLALFPGDRSTVSVNKAFCVGWYIQHPSSRGHVHIVSSEDVHAPLDFKPGYLEGPDELALHKWGYKLTREFARRLPCFRGELVSNHPSFPPGSAAAAGQHPAPVPVSAPELEYTPADDAALEAYIRQAVGTAWHSMGTCAMKPRDRGGVVDPKLNVYGVEGLKVTDISICPGNVAANTYSTAVVIGEKAATIIAEELGISLKDV
ncbi:alcohol oxidase-like protein [Trametes polyzona]|nr:alcohol oxidase-like protein [Trametes polyzona]